MLVARKKRKVSSPTAPSAYSMFMREKRAQSEEKLTITDIAAQWREIKDDAERRKKYDDLAAKEFQKKKNALAEGTVDEKIPKKQKVADEGIKSEAKRATISTTLPLPTASKVQSAAIFEPVTTIGFGMPASAVTPKSETKPESMPPSVYEQSGSMSSPIQNLTVQASLGASAIKKEDRDGKKRRIKPTTLYTPNTEMRINHNSRDAFDAPVFAAEAAAIALSHSRDGMPTTQETCSATSTQKSMQTVSKNTLSSSKDPNSQPSNNPKKKRRVKLQTISVGLDGK